MQTVDKELQKMEALQEFDDDFHQIPPADIVAYNELRSCADIFRMYDKGQLEIQPEFQREEVWNNAHKSMFIDSLAKQLPIPSLCISLNIESGKRIVIDGFQRMKTIIDFLDPDKPFILTQKGDIDPRISGKTNLEIRRDHEQIFSAIENVTLPITVLRCDLRKESHREYIYTIFHRLNTGSVKLTNQEIRNCIFGGSFNNLLKESAKNPHVKTLLGIKTDSKRKYRFGPEEFILRFFAFYSSLNFYDGKLALFLNEFQATHQNIPPNETLIFKNIFERTASLIAMKITLNKKLISNKTVNEALFIGIAKNIDRLETIDPQLVLNAYSIFLSDALFSTEELKEGLAQTGKVKERINKAIDIFSC